MPKISQIPFKKHVTLNANAQLVQKAKDMGMNLSLIFDAALEREVNPEAKEAFERAIKFKNELYKGYIRKMKQEKEFEDFTYGENKNVVEEKKKTDDDNGEVRERQRSVGAIRF